MVAAGQTIALPPGAYVRAYALATSTYGPAGGAATVHYADGTSSTAQLSRPTGTRAPARSPRRHRYTPDATDQHPVSLYPVLLWLDPARQATSLTLPVTGPVAAGVATLHLFALSLQPAVPGTRGPADRVQSTTKQLTLGPRTRAQVVQATVTNIGTEWIDHRAPLTVTVHAAGVRTVRPATISALAPGEQRVEIGMVSAPAPAGLPVDATVR